MTNQFTHIFFDADNTLFDFDGSSKLAFKDLISHLQLSDWQAHYKIYQIYNHQVWSEFEKGKINSQKLRTKRFQLYFDSFSFNYDPLKANNLYLNYLVDHATLYKDSMILLNELKRSDKKLYILTNGLKEVQRPRIRKKSITDMFEAIIVSDEIGVAKPHEDFFKFAHREAGMTPKEKIIMIGDSLKSDIAGGNNYGLFTCWYNPLKKSNNTEVKPNKEVHSLLELRDFLL